MPLTTMGPFQRARSQAMSFHVTAVSELAAIQPKKSAVLRPCGTAAARLPKVSGRPRTNTCHSHAGWRTPSIARFSVSAGVTRRPDRPERKSR